MTIIIPSHFMIPIKPAGFVRREVTYQIYLNPVWWVGCEGEPDRSTAERRPQPKWEKECRTGQPSGEAKVDFYSQTDMGISVFGCFRRAT